MRSYYVATPAGPVGPYRLRRDAQEEADRLGFRVLVREAEDMNSQCQRCGSSVEWVDCWNCDEGFVEKDFGDGIVEDLVLVRCEFCEGTGGHHWCISDMEWCEANPLPGRETAASGPARVCVALSQSEDQ